jgi:hypothetical protein
MAKKLIALSGYSNGPRNLSFRPSEIFEASDDLYLFLMADAPGVFALAEHPMREDVPAVKEEVKALDKPPVDKMVRKPKASK